MQLHRERDMIAATSILQIRATELRGITVNWASLTQANTISTRDFEFISELDQWDKTLPDTNPEQCCSTFLNLIAHINKDTYLHYLLVMIDDTLADNKKRVSMFRGPRIRGLVWKTFLGLLNRKEEFVQHMGASIIAKIACWHPQPIEKEELETYMGWLMDQLKMHDSDYMPSVVRCLQMMLRINEYRQPFLAVDGISVVFQILASRVNFQIQYQLIFCIWVLAFNAHLAEKMNKFNAIPILADILTDSVKEKVTRIILAVFRNLIEKPGDRQISKEHCIAMVQCKVIKQLSILEQKRSDDDDLMNDVEFLHNRLQASVQALSSFDQYSTEVKSGRLEWSPVHKSAMFWVKNAQRLNERSHELLRTLIHLLDTSHDPVVLAVACYDIGEYVRHYPRGKNVIEQIGGKPRVMALLCHDDANVRYEALLAVQKLMVHNWEDLGKQMEQEQAEKPKSNPKRAA